MCVSPCRITVNDREQLVGCRYCWQCQSNRVNDLVGRCIAEKLYSTKTYAVTLTYAGDIPNAATLVYKDYQDFMKRLRKAGYKVRYIVAGEYGSKKGRAHWHAVLFFDGRSPDVDVEKKINWKYWPQGFSYFQPVDYGGLRYVLKYALKDQGADVSIGHLAMSKKPPLGHGYFMDLANKYIKQGISPQSPEYSFDIFDDNGKRRKFWLQGRMREMFLEYFIPAYEEYHGRDYPFSDFIEMQEDKWIAEQNALSMSDSDWRNYLRSKHLQPLQGYTPVYGDGVRSSWDAEKSQHREEKSYLVLKNGMLVVRNTDGTIEIHFGKGETWLVETEDQLGRALHRAQERHNLPQQGLGVNNQGGKRKGRRPRRLNDALTGN